MFSPFIYFFFRKNKNKPVKKFLYVYILYVSSLEHMVHVLFENSKLVSKNVRKTILYFSDVLAKMVRLSAHLYILAKSIVVTISKTTAQNTKVIFLITIMFVDIMQTL